MGSSKISSDFAVRLHQRRPDALVPVIVVLSSPRPNGTLSRGDLKARRQELIREAQAFGNQILGDIDAILTRHGGRRLAEGVNAIGTIAIEATPEGIRALAELDRVKAILENQPIHRIN